MYLSFHLELSGLNKFYTYIHIPFYCEFESLERSYIQRMFWLYLSTNSSCNDKRLILIFHKFILNYVMCTFVSIKVYLSSSFHEISVANLVFSFSCDYWKFLLSLCLSIWFYYCVNSFILSMNQSDFVEVKVYCFLYMLDCPFTWLWHRQHEFVFDCW